MTMGTRMGSMDMGIEIRDAAMDFSVTEGSWLSTPSPTLPTEGEGVCLWLWLDPASNWIGTSPLVGEAGRGAYDA
jgi:hypothetical protein